jgi:hypothetical protein
MNTLHFKKVDATHFQRVLLSPSNEVLYTGNPELSSSNMETLFKDYVAQMKEIPGMDITKVTNEYGFSI